MLVLKPKVKRETQLWMNFSKTSSELLLFHRERMNYYCGTGRG